MYWFKGDDPIPVFPLSGVLYANTNLSVNHLFSHSLIALAVSKRVFGEYIVTRSRRLCDFIV